MGSTRSHAPHPHRLPGRIDLTAHRRVKLHCRVLVHRDKGLVDFTGHNSLRPQLRKGAAFQFQPPQGSALHSLMSYDTGLALLTYYTAERKRNGGWGE